MAEKTKTLERHYLRFNGDIGSAVVFKKDKRKPKQQWRVVEVEVDPDLVHWREGLYPDYIKLEALVADGAGHLKNQTLWTCESRINVIYEPKKVLNDQTA